MSTPTSAPANRRSVARWSVAAVATAALVVSGSGLVAFAQTGTGASQGPAFVPADAVGYVEVRLDMPGGQGDALAEMLTAFPGFADPGSFDLKMDELINGLAAELGIDASDTDLVGAVLTGEVGVALGDLEAVMMSGDDPPLLIGMAVADSNAAGPMAEAFVASQGGVVTEKSYSDVIIYTDTSADPPMSVAVHDDWVLLGNDTAAVQGSIDVLDGKAPSLTQAEGFQTAWSRLPESRLGAAYLDLTPFAAFVDLAGMMAQAETGVALPTQDLAALLPTDMVASLAAETDRLNLEVLVSPPAGGSNNTAVVRESDMALSFPADTQVYLEMRDFGAGVQTVLEEGLVLLASQDMSSMGGGMSMGDEMSLAQLEALLGEQSPITAMLGAPLPEYLDFVGDAGVGAGLSSDGLWLGIAGDVIDQEAAAERVTSLLTILRMFLLGAEAEGVGIETSQVAGVEVTTITLPLDQLMFESGLPLPVDNSIDVALTDDQLLIGMGDFVPNAIIADPADSLGNNAGYLDALDGDTVNAGVTYVNAGALLATLDPVLTMMVPQWQQVAPYATAVDRMIVVPTADEEIASARMSVIVDQ